MKKALNQGACFSLFSGSSLSSATHRFAASPCSQQISSDTGRWAHGADHRGLCSPASKSRGPKPEHGLDFILSSVDAVHAIRHCQTLLLPKGRINRSVIDRYRIWVNALLISVQWLDLELRPALSSISHSGNSPMRPPQAAPSGSS